MNLLNRKTPKQRMLEKLTNVKEHQDLIDDLTTLQNEISVGYNTRVIAVTSIRNERLAAAFADGMAVTYGINGAKTLVVDANLYMPRLATVLNASGESLKVDDKVDAIFMNKEVYPADVYKGGAIHKLIKEHEGEYDHFILIVPEMRDHKEIYLLKDILDAIILVAQRSMTKKKDIFEAVRFFRANNLPIAKTVVVK